MEFRGVVMKTMKQVVNWIKDAKGVATSLVEATATIGVGAVLATVAIGAGVNAINDAKVQTAVEDVRQIGQGIFTSYKDNNFYPIFQDGTLTGPNNDTFTHLVSANGTYPTTVPGAVGGGVILTGTGDPGTAPDVATSWGITSTSAPAHIQVTGYAFSGDGLFTGHDSIEDQLVLNKPGLVIGGGGLPYPLRGAYAADPNRGYHGPYVQNLPPSDPWGNKYLANVQELSSQHLANHHANASTGVINVTAVLVCSAGENRILETSAEQAATTAAVFGDDICFRVK